MTDVYLTRVEPAKNMARYYAMSLQPNLFGEWSLVREWGRIGRGGQVRMQSCASEAEAKKSLLTLVTAKMRRGYSSSMGAEKTAKPLS